MFGLYSGLARRAPQRKRFFFDGVGGRFPLPFADFLAFSRVCTVPCALHCVPRAPVRALFAVPVPCACVLCTSRVPVYLLKRVFIDTKGTKREGLIPCSFILRSNFVQ